MRLPVALAILVCVTNARPSHAQNPLRHFSDAVDVRYSRTQPVVHYVLTIAEGDTTGWDVLMSVRNTPDTFRVAMAKHPEYDDRYFRYVQNLRVDVGSIAREDSAVWRVVAPAGAVVISYRIQLPPPPAPPAPPAPAAPRAAWRPFLSAMGGLTGGAHAFMYVVGAELAPSHVELRLPAAWDVATGLTPTSLRRTYFAPSVYDLVESPIVVGGFHAWPFAIDAVPHTITYLPLANTVPFDTAMFAQGIQRMAAEAVRLFGRPPYREYVFMFQDGAYGGLEHPNSVTLGAPSADLARNPTSELQEAAHEYIHTWNLMRIRPVEYTGVSYKPIQPVSSLWFSEGLTMMYADALLRRAKLPTFDSTRVSHLEYLITRYLAVPGNSRFAAERVSRVAYNATPYELGDYDASTHLQGELLGTVLDLLVRDATNGERSMDDVMRVMLDRFSGERGFAGPDIERAVSDVCACDVRSVFEAHVRGNQPIPFDKYLALIGLRAVVTREIATRDGQPIPDFRLRAWNAPPDSSLTLILGDPQSVWGRAGLHSRDRVISVNDSTPKTWPQFRQLVGRARMGDSLRFLVQAPGAPTRWVNVVVGEYTRPVVRIEEIPNATTKQRRIREAWANAAP